MINPDKWARLAAEHRARAQEYRRVHGLTDGQPLVEVQPDHAIDRWLARCLDRSPEKSTPRHQLGD